MIQLLFIIDFSKNLLTEKSLTELHLMHTLIPIKSSVMYLSPATFAKPMSVMSYVAIEAFDLSKSPGASGSPTLVVVNLNYNKAEFMIYCGIDLHSDNMVISCYQ